MHTVIKIVLVMINILFMFYSAKEYEADNTNNSLALITWIYLELLAVVLIL